MAKSPATGSAPKEEKAAGGDRLKLVIELFSVAAGAAFVLSGFLNGATFWLAWRLNYFLIASPADVVMSGFIVITIFAVCVAAIALVTAGVMLALRALRRVGWTQFKIRWESVWSAASAIIGMVGAIVAAISFLGSVSELQRAALPKRGFVEGGASDSTPASVGPFGYGASLRVHPESSVVARCRSAPVLWLGSSSAVLNCRGRVTVLHNLEGVVTERVR